MSEHVLSRQLYFGPLFSELLKNLKLNNYHIYYQIQQYKLRTCPHSVLMCFVWISQQSDFISLHGINFYTGCF
jgi:hypothetical protein